MPNSNLSNIHCFTCRITVLFALLCLFAVGAAQDSIKIRAKVFLEGSVEAAGPLEPIQIISPTAGTLFNLSINDEMLVQVVIQATKVNETITMELQLDAGGDQIASTTPSSPITIAPDNGKIQRTAEFALSAAGAGNTMVTIVVTDRSGNRAEVKIRVQVKAISAPAIVSPTDGMSFNLSISGEVAESTQVPVVIAAGDENGAITMALQADDEGIASVSTSSITIAVSSETQRTAEFALSAVGEGSTTVTIVVTDSLGNSDRVTIRVRVEVIPAPVISNPRQGMFFSLLKDGGVLASTQVPVVIAAGDENGTITMALQADDEGVASVSTSSITIASNSKTQRTAEFVLSAVGAGNTMVTIVVTDSLGNSDRVTIRVEVKAIPAPIISSPTKGMSFSLLKDGGVLASTQVPVVIAAGDENGTITMALQADDEGIASVSTSSITIAVSSETQRTAEFALSAVGEGSTTVTIVVTDSLGNSDRVTIRVQVKTIPAPIISSPTAGMSFDLLISGEVAESTQVPVVIDAGDENGAITMALQTDDEGVASISTSSITIAPNRKTQRTAEFALSAEGEGNTTVTIVVTDQLGNSDRVTIRVRVKAISVPEIISPKHGEPFNLQISGAVMGFISVPVIIAATDENGAITKTLQLDGKGDQIVSIPGSPITIKPNSEMRRMVRFEISAVGEGNTTVTIVVTDRFENKAEVKIRVQVSAISQLTQIISPRQGMPLNLLISGEVSESTQVQVVIESTEVDKPTTMTLQLDAGGDQIASTTPSSPITIAPDNGKIQRTAEFTLSAVGEGDTTVTIVVTDNSGNQAKVKIRVQVQVVPAPVIVSPRQGMPFNLLISGKVLESIPVPVDIAATNENGTITMELQLDEGGKQVVSIPDSPITIAPADGTRTVEFALSAVDEGNTTVTIVITDRFENSDRVKIRVQVIVVSAPVIVSPRQGMPFNLLISGEVLESISVPVDIEAANENGVITMELQLDEGGKQVVSIPDSPITIAPVDGAMQRTAEFALSAVGEGNTTVTIVITDRLGAKDEVKIRVQVKAIPVPEIAKPTEGMSFNLLKNGGVPESTQVLVVIQATDENGPIAMELQLDEGGEQVVSTTPSSITIESNNKTQRTAEFELSAVGEGNAIVTIVITDRLGNKDEVKIRVQVEVIPLPVIISPRQDMSFNLSISDEVSVSIPVSVVIGATGENGSLTMEWQLDEGGKQVVSTTPSSPIIIAPNSETQRTAEFALITVNVGNTAMTIVVTDHFGNKDEVKIRIEVNTSLRDCPTCPEMVRIPAGTFIMGSPDDEAGRDYWEGPQHEVTIPVDFAVGKYEVTRGQYAEFATSASVQWESPIFTQTDDHPAVNVSWQEAKAYAAWLSEKTEQNYRLLSESEWEYVARAGSTTPYSFGDMISSNQARYDKDKTIPVGRHPPNAFGLHDAHGNVHEWVEDCWHDDYNGAPTDDSAWSSECTNVGRVYRSGSWVNTNKSLRSAYRFWSGAETKSINLGFRLARDLTLLQIISPTSSTSFNLLSSSEVLASMQVQVVIRSVKSNEPITMTLQPDASSEQIVSIPDSPITIAPDNGKRRRTEAFELRAIGEGNTTVTIVATDSSGNSDEVKIRVEVEIIPPPVISSPAEDMSFNLSINGEFPESISVPVTIEATNENGPITMALQLDNGGKQIASISTSSITIAPDNGAQRRAKFELRAIDGGNTTVTIVVTDSWGGSDIVKIRVQVEIIPRPVIISPTEDMPFTLFAEGGVFASTQVPVVVQATDRNGPITMTLQADDEGIVSISTSSITIAPDNGAQRRAKFELRAIDGGNTTVTIVITDRFGNSDTVKIRVEVKAILIIIPRQNMAFTLLKNGGVFASTQVSPVIQAANQDEPITMTLQLDDERIVSISTSSITIAPNSEMQRTTEFELSAIDEGNSTVTIAVTDSSGNSDEVKIHVQVEVIPLPVIISPEEDMSFNLLIRDGVSAPIQVPVIIQATDKNGDITMTLQADDDGGIVSISTSSITIAPNSEMQRTTEFELSAIDESNTAVTIVITDRFGNKDEVKIRIQTQTSFRDCPNCPEMVVIPGGKFIMGSTSTEVGRSDDEGPQHEVTIPAFAVGKYEVTRGQYKTYASSDIQIPTDYALQEFDQSDNHPVVAVSWLSAKNYVAWLSKKTGQKYRLLSESEWEYVARAGTTTRYSFGDTISSRQARYGHEGCDFSPPRCTQKGCKLCVGTVSVGGYPENAFGLHDVYGNASEWVEDCWHDDYNGAPVDGSAWTSACDGELRRVLRGGSWRSSAPRSAHRGRSSAPPFTHPDGINTIGFRVARDLSP